MKITFLGTAGSFLTISKSYPAILINNDLLLDCGEGTTQKLLTINSIQHINIICLTHFHNDHFMGLFSLLWYYWFQNRKKKLEIIGPPQTQDIIEKILDLINTPKGARGLFDLHYTELKDSDILQNLQRTYSIKAIKAEHPITAFSYRIEDGNKSICYTGDTGPSKNIEILAKDCDLLISEATFPNKYEQIAHKYGHTTPRDLAMLATNSNCKQTAIFHISSHYSDNLEDFKVQVEKNYKRTVILAEDLMEIKL